MRYPRRPSICFALLGIAVIILVLFSLRMRTVIRTQRAVRTIERLGGVVYRSDACFANGVPHGTLQPNKPPGFMTRIARLLGPHWFFDVVHVDFQGEDARHALTDEDLTVLSDFPNLVCLDLSGTGVGDDGMTHVAKLTELRNLCLSRTSVTDLGVCRLMTLAHLEHLDLDDTPVAGWGVKKLRAALPNVEVLGDFDDGSDEAKIFNAIRSMQLDLRRLEQYSDPPGEYRGDLFLK